MTLELKINDNIPNFSLPLSDDTLFNSEELKKKLYIIYFYPKDNTPGCTNEAKDFSSLKKDFDKIDAEIIGISKDSIKKHKNFIEKQDLKIKLASDEEGKVIESFGVWVEKKMYGRTYMGQMWSMYNPYIVESSRLDAVSARDSHIHFLA